MYLTKNPLTRLMAGIMMMLAISACSSHDEEDKPDYDKIADHTVLMYMVGDNNLSGLLENNVKQAHRAILDSVEVGALNLVVFKDNKQTNDKLPKLYWVHRNAEQQLDTVMLQTWTEEVDAADPAFFASVLQTTFSKFHSSLNGVVLASHAAGWVPLTNTRRYTSPQRRAFGYDQINPNEQTGTIELWDLSDAFHAGPKLDYVIADCCHMGNAEVAYEFRDVTRYLVASSLEVQGAGMPYRNVITRLARCRQQSDLPDALDYAMQCYFNQNAPYNGSKNGASTALYDLTYMSELATNYQSLIQSNKERLQYYNEAKGAEVDAWLTNFQFLGRERSGSVHYKYYFFDIKDVINWLGENNSSAANAAVTALDKIVLKEYHSDQFYTEIIIDHHCGMAVSLPETLHLANESNYCSYFIPLSNEASNLLAAYHLTEWGELMGY